MILGVVLWMRRVVVMMHGMLVMVNIVFMLALRRVLVVHFARYVGRGFTTIMKL